MFSISWVRTIFVSLVLFTVLTLVFAFSKGHFEWYGFKWGMFFGAMFAVFPLMVLGTRIEIDEYKVIFRRGILSLIFPKYYKSISLSSIKGVRLGLPQKNKATSTFAAINIASVSDEISFNPDLFDRETLQSLFRSLKNSVPNIKLDNYAKNILENENGQGELIKTVGRNFLASVVVILIFTTVIYFLNKVEIIPKDWLYPILGLQLFVVPLIVNKLC